jgi:hypothetical protein
VKKTETEPPGLNFCERIAGGGVFSQWEHRLGGPHRDLRAGRWGSAGARGWAIRVKKKETEPLGLNFCERIAGVGVFRQWEHRSGGPHRDLRAGRWGSAGTGGWAIRAKKKETEPPGFNFCERIMGGGVFAQREHRWGGLHQGLRAGRWGSAGARGWTIWVKKKRKQSCWGSIFANASQGVVYLGSGSTDGVGYTRV